MATQATSACECALDDSLPIQYQAATVVLSGRVLKTTYLAAPYLLARTDIQVRDHWKGPEKSVMSIYTVGDCGYSFKTGQDYLVYASSVKDKDSHRLFTGICQRTIELKKAARDILALNALRTKNRKQ